MFQRILMDYRGCLNFKESPMVIEKAKQFCTQLNNMATPIQLDVTKKIERHQIANIGSCHHVFRARKHQIR